MSVEDLRGSERFTIPRPIPGSYGAAGIVIVNISAIGAQLAHAQPLRVATTARLAFRAGEIHVGVTGLTIWSRFSKSGEDAATGFLYRSGIRIESDLDVFAAAVEVLAAQGLATPDAESMERKRRRLLERNTDKTAKLIVKGVKQPDAHIPTDQVLLVQHARDRLRANPEEAMKWYNRARYAMTQGGTQIADIPNREEVLAVWEYLERSIEVPVIVSVFQRVKKP